MKKTIFFLFLLSWVGYFGLVACDDYKPTVVSSVSHHSSDKNEKISSISGIDLNCFLSQSEYHFHIENPSFPSVKNPFQVFAIHSKGIEQKLNSSFKQFTLFYGNQLFSALKISILFPFHCFW